MTQKIKTNIEVDETYDKEGDVYYVTFKTGEPSVAMEVDDMLIMEVGVFTKMPTGFRILNYKRHNIGEVRCIDILKSVKEAIKEAREGILPAFKQREQSAISTLERVLEPA